MAILTYIVDDEGSARERMEYLINHFLPGRVKVLGGSNTPKTALAQIPKLNPDLAFLDVEMPHMSGMELCEKLKTKGYRGKVVFVTAYDHYSIKAIRAGAFDYLLKPVDVDELVEMINRFEVNTNHRLNPDVIKNFDLSSREVELIEYLSKGFSSEEIGTKLFISRHTVDTHRRNIHTKTGTKNIVELINLLWDK